jgi:ribonuclease HII
MTMHNADPPSSGTDARSGPDFSREMALVNAGYDHIAGVDEAGRGPLAGPVVAAAVSFALPVPEETFIALSLLDDSKKLTARRRETLYATISHHADWVAIASISATRIDQINILQATLDAMRLAILSAPKRADAVLVDGNRVPSGLPKATHARALVGGDGLSLSIAAASIMAKVIRDRMMERLDAAYPAYGFGGHKGYGSLAHRAAIESTNGIERVHRFTFRPLSALNLFDDKKSPADEQPG